MPIAAIISLGTLAAVVAVMAGEALLSSYNASLLRARGAVEPPGDVYRTMQWAYPASFVAMACEGALSGPSPAAALGLGLAVFGLAKALKAWAIATLGTRWSFRVLVPPGEPPIVAGPYRLLNHPNYVAVCGEMFGAALIVGAPVSGFIGTIGFIWLMRRRVAVEDRALGRDV
jgi:methyltransferase